MQIISLSTPHKYSSSDRRVEPLSLCVVHYTATPYYAKGPMGSNVSRVCNWLKGKGRASSTHFVVLRDGSIIQGAELDERTWHSGGSKLELASGETLSGINYKSIGVDFDNVGMLYRVPGGYVDSYEWRSMRKHSRDAKNFYKGPEPYVHGVDGKNTYWEPYNDVAIESMKFLLGKIAKNYDVFYGSPWRLVGHSDIRSTKSDPGPACPMGELRMCFDPSFDPLTLDIPSILCY